MCDHVTPINAGWYAVTEVVRNLGEEGRYTRLPAIAAALRLDTRATSTMWRDAAVLALTQAVMHSFRQVRVAECELGLTQTRHRGAGSIDLPLDTINHLHTRPPLTKCTCIVRTSQLGLAMVDHHTLMTNFMNWYEKERRQRGYVPGSEWGRTCGLWRDRWHRMCSYA